MGESPRGMLLSTIMSHYLRYVKNPTNNLPPPMHTHRHMRTHKQTNTQLDKISILIILKDFGTKYLGLMKQNWAVQRWHIEYISMEKKGDTFKESITKLRVSFPVLWDSVATNGLRNIVWIEGRMDPTNYKT